MQERSQQTVQRILDATLTLLAREGVEGLTTNRVADEAGLSVASLYRFFPNKQAVIYAAYAQWIGELAEHVAAASALWRGPLAESPHRWPEAAAALADVLGESRRGARAEYELLRAMFSHRELRALDAEYTQLLAEQVADLMRLAGARASQVDLIALAAFANEQFTLAAELGGRPGQPQEFATHARNAYFALWQTAIGGDERVMHDDNMR